MPGNWLWCAAKNDGCYDKQGQNKFAAMWVHYGWRISHSESLCDGGYPPGDLLDK